MKDNFQGQFVDEWKKGFEKESFDKVRKSINYFMHNYFIKTIQIEIFGGEQTQVIVHSKLQKNTYRKTYMYG